jgi:hypothetical protein
LWPDQITVNKIEQKVNAVKNDIKEEIAPKKENTAQEFKSVDRVIEDSKVINSKSTPNKLQQEVAKEVEPKNTNRSGNFTNIDAVITPGQESSTSKSASRTNPAIQQQSQSNVNAGQQNFKSIQSIIINDQSAKPAQKSYQKTSDKSIVPESLKKKQPSQVQPMKGFNDINTVIKK